MLDEVTGQPLDAQDALRAEQLLVLAKNGLVSIPMNFVLAISIVVALRDEVSWPLLLLWIICIFLLNAARFACAYLHVRRTFQAGEAGHGLRINSRLMLFTGAAWALVPSLMLDVASPHAAGIYFILAGISAGATIQSASSAVGASAFAMPIFATLIGKLIWSGPSGYFLALDASLYVALILQSARNNEANFARTVRLTIEATRLAASLDREHTASKATAARFFELANQDALTGLANRTALSTCMASWLDGAGAPARRFYLFLLDLDHFKSINDTLGHSAGDEILKQVAKRLTTTVGADNVVARLGGDEFAILVAQSPDDRKAGGDEADHLASHILAEVSGTFQLGERSVSIGASLGVARFPDDGDTAESLLAHADLALYAAKDGGRHHWRRFDASLLATATMTRDIEHDLPTALSEGLLEVFYQPQVSLADDRLAGLEALLRWKHPVHGWISPPMVVAAARRIRKSDLLTEFVLDQVCRQIRRLNDDGRPDVLVAINVSPSELGHYDLPALVQRMVTRHTVDCRQIEVEITEEAFAASTDALAILSALSAMGVRLAIDDFGTGYSSIAYLRSMRVDRIKIDRSFVTGFADREGDRILVQAIIGIGRSFGIEVLAEGAETADDVLLLKTFGCDVVQGYHFARPLNQADFAAWQAEHDRKHGLAARGVGTLPPFRLPMASVAA